MNGEEFHNNVSKLIRVENCVLALIRALTRMGCLQALGSGPTIDGKTTRKDENKRQMFRR